MTTDSDKKPVTPICSRIPLIPALLILVILGIAIFGEKGVLRAVQANRHKEGLQAQIREQEAAITRLKSEVEALRSDSVYLEGIARRELGMVKEDELVYQFSSKPESAKTENP